MKPKHEIYISLLYKHTKCCDKNCSMDVKIIICILRQEESEELDAPCFPPVLA